MNKYYPTTPQLHNPTSHQHPLTPLGIFDSGYGGLTVFRSIKDRLPQYDYLYLGDNARAPYGNRSFETIHAYTWQCVQWLFAQGCPLVILACNTASAKALRRIQQRDLPDNFPDRRVLGVIRPTAERIGQFEGVRSVGILGTQGTVQSGSYLLEIQKFHPGLKVAQQACPLLVPLIEDGQQDSEGAVFFLKQYLNALLQQAPDIDLLLLACTHYPLMADSLRQLAPPAMRILSQGPLVADRLSDYLERHPQMAARISQRGQSLFYTTGEVDDFERHASLFFGEPVAAAQTTLSY